MKQIANESGQSARIELNVLGDIKILKDSTRYQMQNDGWHKVAVTKQESSK